MRVVAGILAGSHLGLACLVFFTSTTHVNLLLGRLREELGELRRGALARSVRTLGRESLTFHFVTLLGVLACAAAIRHEYLDLPMDYDEAHSFLNYARRPIYQAIADYNSTNNHLLNTLFMHVQYRLLGQQDWALRLHVLVAGVAVTGATYLLGRVALGAECGLLSASFTAVSYVLVNYSINARGYMWVAWMTIVLLIAAWRILNAASRSLGMDWIVSAVSSVVGLFAAPIMLYAIVAALWLMLAGLARRGRRAIEVLFAGVIWLSAVGTATLWLYAPAFMFRGLEAWRHPFVTPQDWPVWADRVVPAWRLALECWSEGPVPWLATALFGVIGLVALAVLNRRGFMLVVSVPLMTFAIMALQRVTPPPRVFCFVTPLFGLAVAHGVMAIILIICYVPPGTPPPRTFATPSFIACVIAWEICVWGYVHCRNEPLPGSLRPVYLVEDVRERDEPPREGVLDQRWRLCIPDAVELIAALSVGAEPVRVLVVVPADLPFHYYAAKFGLTVPIGGQPQVGERLILLAAVDDEPTVALRLNPSLQIRDPQVLNANWQLVSMAEMAVWQATVAPVEATDASRL